eukprot:Opistho-2@45174
MFPASSGLRLAWDVNTYMPAAEYNSAKSDMYARHHAQSMGPITRTTQPSVTGTSVLGVKFDGGVVLAADTLASYGSMARFMDVPRLTKINDTTLLGMSGDYADFQSVQTTLESLIIEDESVDDGHRLSPVAIHSYLTRVMYNRRSKFNPLWNEFLVAGFKEGRSFLGFVDKLGVAYEDACIATGYGAYIAVPLLRAALEKKPTMTEAEARKLLTDSLRVLFYRDARSLNRYQIAVVSAAGVKIDEPKMLDTNWDIGHMVSGFE